MDRRSFVASLFGGLAAASLGGIAIAQAASPKLEAAPATPTAPANAEIDAATKAGLDQTEAEFSQYRGNHRGPRHHVPHHRHRRPPVHRPVHRRPRRVVRNGRVYYIR